MKKYPLMLLLLLPPNAHAAEWYKVMAPMSGSSEVFIEVSSITFNEKVRKAWTMNIEAEGVYTGRYSKNRLGFDCQKMESATFHVSIYNPDESLIASGDIAPTFSAPKPDSSDFEIMSSICSTKNKDKVVKDLRGFRVSHPLEGLRADRLRRVIESAKNGSEPD